MFSSTLWRNRCNRAFHDFQKCLLHTFTGYIPGNGSIFGFSCNFINLIDVDDSLLCPLDIIVSGLDNLKQNVFHVFSYITGFCQRSGICDRKGNIQHSCQILRQESFTGTGRTKHQNITFLQFHIIFSA